MSAPPPAGGQPYGPPYQGPVYYPPMNIEGFLTKKMVWAANAVGLLLIWLGFVLILSGLVVTGGFAAFLIVTGATLGALASVTGALGSKRTTDLQNLGLLVWAGLLLAFGIGVAL